MRTTILTLVLSTCGALSISAAASNVARGDETNAHAETSLRENLVELTRCHRELEANMSAQTKAWPTRLEDTENELSAPPVVVALQKKRQGLEASRRQIVSRIEKTKDIDTLISAIESTKIPALRMDIVPIAVRVGAGNRDLLETLSSIAIERPQTPSYLVSAIETFEEASAARLLFSLGASQKNAAILAAALRHGHADLLNRLILLADGESSDLLPAARKALARIVPPDRVSTELLGKVRSWAESAQNLEVRCLLLSYLGRCKDPSSLRFIVRSFERSDEPRIRASALGALSHLGDEASSYLIEILQSDDSDESIQRRCIISLGAARSEEAVPALIERLADRRFQSVAARALRRISGQNFKHHAANWKRWWAGKQAAEQDR